MKLNAANIQTLISKPLGVLCYFLVYGPEEGLASIISKQLSEKIVGNNDSAFNVTRFDCKQIQSDPSLLADEMRSLSLLGGDKLIIINDVGAVLNKNILELFKTPIEGTYCILQAGDLKPVSTVRKAFEQLEHAAAIACYRDTPYQIAQYIMGYAKNIDLKIDRELASFLSEMLPPNRLLIHNELERIALYANDKQLSADELRSVLLNSAELKIDDLCYAFIANDNRQMTKILNVQEDLDYILILRSMQKYVMRLIEAITHRQTGLNASQAVAKLAPPVYFKQKDDLIKLASQIKIKLAISLLEGLMLAELDCKSGNATPDLMLRTFLLNRAQIV